jgi:hypothetical protein
MNYIEAIPKLFETISYLLGMSFSLMMYLWYIPLVLVICLIVSILESYHRYRFHPRHLLVLSPLALCPIILLLGIIFQAPPSDPIPTVGIGSNVTFAAFILQMILCFRIIYGMRGYRLITASIVALELNFGFFCLFVASMYVTGVWL